MADRYAILSAGNHNYTDTATWSSTADGLTTPASAPTSADAILPSAIIANGATLTVDTASQACLSIDMSSVAAYQVTLAGSQFFSVYGTINTTGMLWTKTTGTFIRPASGVTANVTIPQTLPEQLLLGSSSASTGIVNLLTNINIGTYSLQWRFGTINTNDKTITCGVLNETTTQARTYNWGNSVINCTSFTMTSTNLTLGANTATINISGTGVLAGGAVNYNGASFSLNGTAHTVSGSNTFEALVLPPGTTQTITFTDGTTQHITTPTLSGSAGHVHTLRGSGTAGWALIKDGSGDVICDYISVSYSTVS